MVDSIDSIACGFVGLPSEWHGGCYQDHCTARTIGNALPQTGGEGSLADSILRERYFEQLPCIRMLRLPKEAVASLLRQSRYATVFVLITLKDFKSVPLMFVTLGFGSQVSL